MNGNFAPRNRWKQSKKQTAIADCNTKWQRAGRHAIFRSSAYTVCLRRQTATVWLMRNSCKELVAPMEKHQHHGRLPGCGLLPQQL
jgi:hypothetical protein